MTKPVECESCGVMRSRLYPSGYCHSCREWQEKEDATRVEARRDFPWDESIRTDSTILTYVCRKCGGDRFIVGSGDYRTVIKCAACGGPEHCVHEG